MPKYLKFETKLVPLILTGTKTSTWRLWDDKNLETGDTVEFFEFGIDKAFAKAEIIKTIEKPFRQLTEKDKKGHEEYKNDQQMYETYSKYYNRPVGPDTLVKIIWFKLS